MNFRACVSVAALFAAGALPSIVLAQQVGTVAAVNRDMRGTPPDAAVRELNLGLDVIRNERVETSAAGSGQLMFLDQTTLTVSPNSDIVLDDYVYDPEAGSGDLALSMTRGALRFIGGRITKTGPATVRTPTATVGIRGGMAVLDVGPDGVTEVIHIAGEYTSVRHCGDANGDGMDDGCGPGEALSEVVLSRPNASARADGNGVRFTGLATSDQLAGIYGRLEGQGRGGVAAAPSDPAVAGEAQQIAQINSGVAGGVTRTPVSTSGEQAAPAAGPAEQVSEPMTIVQTVVPTVGGQPGDVGGGGEVGAGGGAVFSPALGYRPFDSVSGSITGEADGETITFPVPVSPDALLREHPEGAEFTPRAVALHPGAGLFTFGPENASSTTLGPLEGEFGATGTGFADLHNRFVFVPFVSSSGGEHGVALFGEPTPGQGAFFPGDPNTPGAQTVDAYHNEHGLDLGRSFLVIGDGGRNPSPETLYLVGRSGESRLGETVTHDGVEITVSPGRAIAGSFTVEDGAERLALFVEPLTTTPSGALEISGAGFVTLNEGGLVSWGEPAYGTFEDGAGNTLFGPSGDYLVLSSVHRDRDGSLNTTDFGTDQVLLGEAGSEFDPFRASLFARDETQAEVIAEPLPLAREPDFGHPSTAFSGGFAAAMAVCSSGNCGDFDETGDFAGVYPLFSAAGPVGTQIGFDETGAGMHFFFAMEDDGLANIANAGAGGETDPETFFFSSFGNFGDGSQDSWGGYLDDSRFAAVVDGTQVIAGNEQIGTVGLGSSGLVGTGGVLPAGVETQPEYLRWGYWSAKYDVTDGTTGQTRTDLVPAGAFITGNLPNPEDIPFAGSAEYSGLAVGTAADLATGETRTVGGSFTLGYDFGDRSGTFGLSLPGFSAPNVSMGVQGDSGFSYIGEASGPIEARVQGGFFSGGGNPAAATAGNFGIRDHIHGTAAIGVYGGDQTSFTPGVTAAAN